MRIDSALVALSCGWLACAPSVKEVQVRAPAVDHASPTPEWPADWLHERRVGDRLVRIVADPRLDGAVATLFAGLDEIIDGGGMIADGSYLPVGWTTLRLREVDGGVLVMNEPDYDGDPETERRDDITRTLQVLGAQWSMLDLVAQPLTPVNFDQHVLVGGDALTVDSVFLMRVPSPGARLSGWRLVPSAWDGSEELELESIRVFELMQRRPALMAALLLPPGTMAYFEKDALTLVLDAKDTVLYRSPSLPDE